MNDKIWQWIGDYCSGLLEKSEERKLRAWMDEAEENKLFFMEGVKMVLEYQVVTRSDKNASDSLKHVREKIKVRKRRQLWVQITAVASVMILFVLSFVFFYTPKSEKMSPVLAKVHAGGTKATLIVADGIQVDLTQDNLQEVIEQYGATVLKDKKNELRYDNAEVNDEIEEKPIYHTISAPVGGEYHFTLADGTMVWLNSSSRLTFPTRFTGDSREVLVEGEVYFDVKHDEVKPFIVEVEKDYTVQVLGTEFNIRAYGESSRATTLVKGRVQVRGADNTVLLEPGQQAFEAPGTNDLEVLDVDVAPYVAWHEGKFHFVHVSLKNIMEELSRWYDVQVIFENPVVQNECFTIEMQRFDDFNKVLRLIERTGLVTISVDGHTVTVK